MSQAVAVLSAFVCSYLLYGEMGSGQVFKWPTVVGGLSVVLLALMLRIADDVEDLRDDVQTGRVAAHDGGRRHLAGLIGGGAVAFVCVAILNATCSVVLLASILFVLIWCPAVLVIKKFNVAKALQFGLVETGPAVFLLYSYVAWSTATGDSVPALGVAAVTGLFWSAFQFWSFTRKIGSAKWSPWGLTVDCTRLVLWGFLGLAALCGLIVMARADLSIAYGIYAVGLSTAFGVAIGRYWSRGLQPMEDEARWAGLPFGAAVEAGVFLALAAALL